MLRGFALLGLFLALGRPALADGQMLTYAQYWELNRTQPEEARAYALGLMESVFTRYGVAWPCVWEASGETVSDDLALNAFDLDAYGLWTQRADELILDKMRAGEMPPFYDGHADQPTYLSAATVLIEIDYGCKKI